MWYVRQYEILVLNSAESRLCQARDLAERIKLQNATIPWTIDLNGTVTDADREARVWQRYRGERRESYRHVGEMGRARRNDETVPGIEWE